MAARTTPVKPRATPARKPRRTKAEIDAERAAATAAKSTPITPGLLHQADVPDIDGGAVDFGSAPAKNESRERSRVVLFRYDGVGYTIPSEFGMLDALAYTDVVRREGLDAALVWTLNYSLGTVGFHKLLSLRDDPNVGEEQVQRLIDIVIARIVGADSPKG